MQGLTEHEADQRLAQHGYNEIPEEKTHPLLKFLSYFWGPIPWMIEAALVLSALAQRLPDFLIILVLLLVNSVVGFWQEHKAENAIEILKQRLSPVARVLRDGQWKKIPARELVPDDVVKIRIGDIVPADVEIVEGEGTIDESALTGESLPVSKKAGELLYASSVVRQGEFVGVVRATGVNTYFGKTTTLVERAKGQSHLQRFILKVGDFLIILAVALVLVVLLVGFERHEDMGELLRFALVLMVSAIPAALPAVLSVTMAVGAIALAKRQAIARRLVAIEEMAGMDVLCSDKTGTLTLNQLKPATPITLASDEREVILYAALASRVEDDPIDAAILGEAKRLGISTEGYHVVEFTPWDPVSKRTQALVEKDGARLQVSKGAPQVLAQMAGEDVSAQVDALAERGYRTIAVAVDTGDGWRLAGLIPLHDPPRPDSAKVLDEARQLGVEVKMLTGDHIAIAKEVASLLHLGSRIVNASEVAEKPYPEAARTIEQANGFAEVFPEHKYTIVDALQKHGHIVGMTGMV